jgi:hypothetical protein
MKMFSLRVADLAERQEAGSSAYKCRRVDVLDCYRVRLRELPGLGS